ncbi:MFS transporter [Paraburkholderia strydomiana]|uniref:MFS transporter n=1 Tax=Paraburkholderia strydomiana TaxID=1245417 RepID=A0ABW9ERW1_9BURK
MTASVPDLGRQQLAIVDVPALIDNGPISLFQKMIMLLTAAAVVVDGFDVQAIGFVAPAIIRAWGADRLALGLVFSASVFGLLVGSFVLSMLADRIGRRPVLIGSLMFIGVCMLGTTLTRTVSELLLLRFVTGLGLGGVMANSMALVAEYSPARKRVTMMTWVSCGFTIGAVGGGLASAALIPWGGWKAVFIFGGIPPLLIGAAMLPLLPESIQFQVTRRRDSDRIARWLMRIAPDVKVGPGTRYVVHEKSHDGVPIAELFRSGRAMTTVLLWGINFANLLNLYFLSNWLPALLADAGFSVSAATLIGTALQVGGVIGTFLMGPLIDRFGFYRILLPSFLVAVFAIGAIGQLEHWPALFIIAVLTSGFCVIGGQPAINALSATVYPTAIRATGVGWSLGVGRIGAMMGPAIAGQLIRLQWSNGDIFFAAAVPALFACGMLYCMSQTGRMPSVATSVRAVGH